MGEALSMADQLKVRRAVRCRWTIDPERAGSGRKSIQHLLQVSHPDAPVILMVDFKDRGH
jgi:hypothetical protein